MAEGKSKILLYLHLGFEDLSKAMGLDKSVDINEDVIVLKIKWFLV